MDGSGLTTLINDSIIHPFWLALDLPTQTVYWLDNYLEYIHAVDYWGRFKRRNVAVHKMVGSISGRYSLYTYGVVQYFY